MKRIILGVDPGFTATGFSILRLEKGQTTLLAFGALPLSSSLPMEARLALFYTFFNEKIATFSVTEVALETPFMGKNAQNFLKLGYLRGILLLLSHQHGCVVREFTPRQVKLAVTGFGGAEKDQVMRTVLRLFPRLGVPNRYDITDAIAVSLCALWDQSALYKSFL